MNKTKEEILNAALNLFSQKGFSTVSIRDICAVVNIKESTVYYHFQNKEAILNEILNQFENHSESLIAKMSSVFPALMSAPQGGDEFLSKIMNEYIDNYLTDPFCNKVIRILSIDQLNNPEVHQLYTYWLFEKPLEIQQFVFSMFNKAGIISCDDPAFAAEKFYAPFFFCLSRYLISGELTQEKIDKFKESIFRHIEEYDALNVMKKKIYKN